MARLKRTLPKAKRTRYADFIRPEWITVGVCLSIVLFTVVTVTLGVTLGLMMGTLIVLGMPMLISEVQVIWDAWYAEAATRLLNRCKGRR